MSFVETRTETEELRRQLQEAQDALRAIRKGEIDAIIVEGAHGARVFSLTGAETVYRLAVETMIEAVLNVAVDGTILYCNAGFSELVGEALELLPGRNVLEFVAVAERQGALELLGDCAREPQRRRLLLDRADGTTRAVQLSGTVLAGPGATTLCLVLADLTALESAKQELLRLRQQKEALEESEARFRAVLENSKDLVYRVDLRNGRYEYISPSAEAVTGYAAEELMAIAGETALAMIHPDDQPAVSAALARLAQKGKADVEYRWRKKNAEWCWLANSMVLIRDSAGQPLYRNGSVRDVTQRRRREEALRLSEEKFNKAFANNPAAIALTRIENGEIVDVNDTWVRLTGYAREALIGRPAGKMWACPDARKRFVETLCEKGSVLDWEQQFVKKSGEIYTGVVSAVTIPVNSEVLVLTTLLDITGRKQAENALRGSHAKLEIANRELEAFTYSVSHDLRAPLRSIAGFAGVLAEQYEAGLDADARHCLQMVRDGTQRMNQLIDHLLALSRLGQQPLVAEPVSMEALVHAALRDLDTEQRGRRVRLVVGKLPLANADPQLLKQVWTNLLSNALKFTRGRELAIIEVGHETQAGKTVYFVRDNGTGFDMRYAGKLFFIFQRLHREEEFEGTGVGLAIAKRVVERHGGRIWAQAAKDAGATFYFTLEP